MPPYKSHERLMIVVLKAAPRLKVIVYNWAGTKWEASTARTIELQRCVENNRWELGMCYMRARDSERAVRSSAIVFKVGVTRIS